MIMTGIRERCDYFSACSDCIIYVKKEPGHIIMGHINILVPYINNEVKTSVVFEIDKTGNMIFLKRKKLKKYFKAVHVKEG